MKKEEMDKPRWEMTPQDIVLMTIESLAFIAQVVLCLFFYNTMDLDWLLILGWAILAAALVLGWRARVAFETKGKPRERKDWLHTTVVVNSGIYAIVRHPMYLSFILISLTLVLLCQHWLNALLGLLLIGLLYNDMGREERGNIEKFGDAYLDYMEQVPKANFVVGIIRLARKKEL